MVRKNRIKKDFVKENIDNVENDIEDLNIDAVTDSEEEYTETEKRLLEKVRKQHTTENFDSDDEVYGLQDKEEEEEDEDDQHDSMESDIEGTQEDYDLPNDKAWGSKTKTFYSSDFKYTDYTSVPEKDLVNADMEEEEGRKLHLRSMKEYLSLEGTKFNRDKTPEILDNKFVFQQLSKEEKEYENILRNTFNEYIKEIKNILIPFLELVKNGLYPECSAATFLKLKCDILLNYCINISFFLIWHSKSRKIVHPIIKRLEQYHQMIEELQSKQGNLLEQAVEIINAIKQTKSLFNESFQIQFKKEESIQKESKSIDDLNIERDSDDFIDEKNSIILHNSNEKVDETKRAITYQMAKNRGLTPYRKKELRNPRVKHRNKYRKAKIRRKGAVREVRKEITRYAGEISGIKAGVKKSIKLK